MLKENIMKKCFTKITGMFVTAFILLSMSLAVGLQVNAAMDFPADIDPESNLVKGREEEYTPAGTIPDKDWSDNQWTVYKRAVAKVENLKKTDREFYYDLDGVPLRDTVIYRHYGKGEDGYYNYNDVKLEELTPSEKYPGCYIFDTTKYDSGETSLYIFSEMPTESFRDWKKSFSIDKMGDDQVAYLHLFTVSYEQNEDIDILALPKTQIYYAGEHFSTPDLPGKNNMYGKAYDQSDYFMGAYSFSHWANENGDKMESYSSSIGRPTVLHPTFVKTQERVKATDYYKIINVDNVQDLLQAVCVTGNWEKEGTSNLVSARNKLVILKGDVVINKAALEEYVESDEMKAFKERWPSSATGYVSIRDEGQSYLQWFAENNLIIEDGASLTFDNVYSNVNGGGGLINLVVQDGGKLHFQNKGYLSISNDDSGWVVSLQKDGVMSIDGDCMVSVHELYNHGTVKVTAPEVKPDSLESRTCLHVWRHFYNAKSGKVTTEYGKIDIDGDIYQAGGYCSPGTNKTNEVSMTNRGLIATTKDGSLEFDGESGNDKYQLLPFVNEGTIEIKNTPGANYHQATCELRQTALINRGTFTIEQGEFTPSYSASSFDDISHTPANNGLNMWNARLINEGKLNVTAVSGLAVRTGGTFFDADSYNKDKEDRGSDDYKSKATGVWPTEILNEKSGEINLESDKDSVALTLDDKSVLTNKGKVTIVNTDKAPAVNNITLCVREKSKINNEGSIVNNGTIGYKATYSEEELKMYVGSAYTGTGTESFNYEVAIRDSAGESITAKTDVTLKVDGETIEKVNYNGSIYAYFPANKTSTVVVSATGYKDGSVSFTSAKDLAAYVYERNEKNENRRYGFTVTMGSANAGGSGDNGGGSGGDSSSGGDAGNTSNSGNTGNGGSTGDTGNTGNGGSTGDTGNTGNTGTGDSNPVNNTSPVDANDGNKVTTTANGEATITEVKKTNSKSITVPSTTTVDGVKYNVTTINANAFKNAAKAKTVTLPDTITKIKANAFAGSKIATVKITIKKGGKLTIDKKAFKKSKVKKVQVFMNKKATKKEQNAVINAFKKAGIKVKNIKLKLK